MKIHYKLIYNVTITCTDLNSKCKSNCTIRIPYNFEENNVKYLSLPNDPMLNKSECCKYYFYFHIEESCMYFLILILVRKLCGGI